ncbi:predicted protein [Streptomyces viridosporus ATCC 14672]|uniref:Predicted protein n=1 Tax=Streptomyces viridosporus (strain ATCC 14672 / DSM 40746 / JCM 4963 / KCTC 9882 / NRRL B-12104 / FH 1290) TaxID=566461 RepID=D5ZXZ4_STRV1|nr:predicted protein [Streptomyces viridosporus ATCC 14672]
MPEPGPPRKRRPGPAGGERTGHGHRPVAARPGPPSPGGRPPPRPDRTPPGATRPPRRVPRPAQHRLPRTALPGHRRSSGARHAPRAPRATRRTPSRPRTQ